MPKHERYQTEPLQGALDMPILQTLRWGPQHGYGISHSIRAGSCDVLLVETGSLRPSLHRLEKQGWTNAEWRTSEHNQRAKCYQFTAAGKTQLTNGHSRWNRMSAAIASLLNPGERGEQA